MTKKDKVIRFRVTELTHKRFRDFCDKFDINPSDFLRQTIEGISNERLEKFLINLSHGKLNAKYDEIRGLFTMEIKGETIEMDIGRFTEMTKRMEEETSKLIDKIGKEYIRIKKG